MKRIKSTLLILVIAIALVLTSCSTTIAIKRLVPAKVDVSGYKTIGVRSTIDETRWVHPVFWGSYVPITGVSDLYLRYLAFSSYLDFNASSRITDAATHAVVLALEGKTRRRCRAAIPAVIAPETGPPRRPADRIPITLALGIAPVTCMPI